ncbi:hypothetical protein [Hahella sp. KA22]|uniref:hypothetical protein n=1 Tax=Hahella sp. KA22 TaxID=1628392 RepID=UPI001F4D60B8|nr:hypothetical protein [Hahella sp. KA22]
MYSTRRYEFKHWTDLTIVDLSFVESPFFAASYAERCLNNDMKVSEIVGNLSGPHFRSAFGAFPGRGTPYFRKWKEDFVRLVERGDILLVFKDGKKPFSPIAREEDEGIFPTNSDPVLAERLIARANPEPPPPPMLNGLLKDIPSLNGNLWWESVPAERRNYLPPPSKRSETPDIAQAEPDETTSLTEDEREEVYRDFWEAKKQGDASAILAMEEKLGDEFYSSLETGGGGPFGKYYAIPKERAELMLEGLRVIERGSPIDDVRAFDNKIRDIRKNLINASSDPIAARRSIEVSSLEGLSERVALEDVGSFVTEIPPRLGELEEIYAGAITAVMGHPALVSAEIRKANLAAHSTSSSKQPHFTGAGEIDDIFEAAEAAYSRIRGAYLDDVPIVSTNAGLSIQETTALKKHLFFGKHNLPLDDVRWELKRFAADDEIAHAWELAQKQELTAGQKEWFRQLSDHELGERVLMSQGVPYRNPAAWDASALGGAGRFNSTPPGAHDLAPPQPDWGSFPGFEDTLSW